MFYGKSGHGRFCEKSLFRIRIPFEIPPYGPCEFLQWFLHRFLQRFFQQFLLWFCVVQVGNERLLSALLKRKDLVVDWRDLELNNLTDAMLGAFMGFYVGFTWGFEVFLHWFLHWFLSMFFLCKARASTKHIWF